MNEFVTNALLNSAFSYNNNLFKKSPVGALQRMGTGALVGITTTPITHFANEFSNEKLKKYIKEDKNFNPLHAAAITALPVASTIYSTGAMMHSMSPRTLLFGSKKLNNAQKLKLLGNIVNPVNHIKRGLTEAKNSFKLFEKGISGGTRFFRGFNLLSLGLSLLPALFYKKGIEDKQKIEQLKQNLNYNQPLLQKQANLGVKTLLFTGAVSPFVVPYLYRKAFEKRDKNRKGIQYGFYE